MKTMKASDKTGILISTFYFISVVVAVGKQYLEIRCQLDNYSCRCQNFRSFWCRLLEFSKPACRCFNAMSDVGIYPNRTPLPIKNLSNNKKNGNPFIQNDL